MMLVINICYCSTLIFNDEYELHAKRAQNSGKFLRIIIQYYFYGSLKYISVPEKIKFRKYLNVFMIIIHENIFTRCVCVVFIGLMK